MTSSPNLDPKVIDDEPVCETDTPGNAAPVGHQEDSTGHQNGAGHDHEHIGYQNGQGHQKFHGDDVCDAEDDPKLASFIDDEPVCETDTPGNAAPVGHQEDSTGHQNGAGHDHEHIGYQNGQGHQKFHGNDVCDLDGKDLAAALFNLPPLDETVPSTEFVDEDEFEPIDFF